MVVYDKEADTQAMEPILELGALLSHEVERPVFAVLNHDDDVLCFWLFEGGALVDSYNSDPGAFEDEEGTPPWQDGNAEKLCARLGSNAEVAVVEAILRGDDVFAVERHEQLARALSLPSCSIGFGYGYVANGELVDDMNVDELIFVGGRDDQTR